VEVGLHHSLAHAAPLARERIPYGMPLEIEVDRYRGLTILPESLPAEPASFSIELAASLDLWQERGYRLAWLELPISRAELVPLATAEGFRFHHCDESSIMLTRRLSRDSFVPPASSHYLGAGGVVISPEGELLTVVERYGPDTYKLPGGLVEVGEEIAAGVRREVVEETGVHTEFESLVGVTHAPRWVFGRASLYLVCRLQPTSREIVIGEDEIAEASWMPVSEFMSCQRAAPFVKGLVKAALAGQGLPAASYSRGATGPDWETFLPAASPHD
jgi:8-oxo-dGTP diphosphatase